MKKLFRPIAAIALTALLMSSCMDWLNSDQFEKNRATADDFFSFSTTSEVVLCLDYGTTGARALVRLYDQYPLLEVQAPNGVDSISVLNESLNPLYQQFTDDEGKVFTKISLPAHVTKEVWLYSDFMALPQCEYCEIEEGVIFNFRHVDNPDFTKAAATKAVVSNPKKFKFKDKDNFYSVVEWSNKYGKPNDVNGLITAGKLTTSDINAIKSAVWNGASSKPSGLNNSQYAAKSTDLINTQVQESYHDDEGYVQTVTSAEVFFTFIQESGWNENVVGYYFYPTDSVPASPANLNKYIILPNASISGNPPYGSKGFNNTNWGSNNAPVSTNQKIQLLYEDKNGNMTPNFPPKTTIGYFIIANGWNVNGGNTYLTYGSTTKAVKSGNATIIPMQENQTKAVNKNITIQKYQNAVLELDDYYTNVEWSQTNYNYASVSARNENGKTKYADVNTWAAGTVTITAKRTNWSIFGLSSTTTLGTWNITVTDGPVTPTPTTKEDKLAGAIDFSKPLYYSNKEWNTEDHCMTRVTAGYIIYGFEDSNDNSFEDVLFTISSTPKQAVLDPLNPDIVDPKEQKLKVGQHDFATYCFEDLWPYQGDYDMNDVVIEHASSMYFNNDNDLLEVVDSFTVCNEKYSSGIGVKDAFAIRIPENQRGHINLPAGAEDETETSSIILFENAQDHIGETFVIKRLFNPGEMKLSQLTRGLDLDPFIIPVMPDETISCRDDHRREVHFPKKTGTSKIEPLYYINDVEAFYVFRDNLHPFAISIPLPAAKTADEITKAKKDGSMFVVPAEMGIIDGQYSKSGHSFTQWVESAGKSNTDWYTKYYPKSGEKVRTEMKRK